jgi:RND family efflux transporter MFP subunit
MKSTISIITLSLTALLLTNCGNKEKKAQENNAPAVAVTLNKVDTNNSKTTITSSGKIEASQSAILSTRLMGHTEKILVAVGDKVSKGQLLLKINSADLLAKKAQVTSQINASNSALANAKKDFDRYTNLYQKQSVSKKELENIATRYEMAKSNHEAAQEMKKEIESQLDYTFIKAPFSGVITQKFTNEGNMANPGMPLLSIENSKHLEVTTLISEADIHNISLDSKTEITIKSINKSVEGEIVSISNSSSKSGGQFSVKINLQNTDSKILAGMYANVQIETKEKIANKVFIPLTAVVQKGQLSGVYTVSSSDTAILRWLRLGKKTANKVEVLSGLNTDEKYIINASGKLYNGVKVSIQ